MKKVLILLICFFSVELSYSQIELEPSNISFDYGYVKISGIEHIDSASVEIIHDSILKWIITRYKAPKNVIKSDLPSMIVFEGYGPQQTFDGGYKVRLVFEIKKGRYRWTMNDITFRSNILERHGIVGPRGIETLPWYEKSTKEERIQRIIKDFSPFVFSFRSAIREYSDDSDW